MIRTHPDTAHPSCRRALLTAPVLGVSATLALLAGVAVERVEAQTLTRALCPIASPFDLQPPGWQHYTGGGRPMLRRTIDLTDHPDAKCNDGSPAIMYIRPSNHLAPALPPSNKWLIFFDGGGGCRDEDACLLTRWCSGGSEVYSVAGKMSSRGALVAIDPLDGIWNAFPPGTANFFADFNQVLVHYCSSDTWTGSIAHTGLTTSTGVSFDIEFQGEAIVDAVIKTLLDGPTRPDPSPLQLELQYELPDLDEATKIVFGGESAGANGLRHHIDDLREGLVARTGATVVAVGEQRWSVAPSARVVDLSTVTAVVAAGTIEVTLGSAR